MQRAPEADGADEHDHAFAAALHSALRRRPQPHHEIAGPRRAGVRLDGGRVTWYGGGGGGGQEVGEVGRLVDDVGQRDADCRPVGGDARRGAQHPTFDCCRRTHTHARARARV